MNIDLKFNKNELSKVGMLDIYIKRKLKYYFSKNLKIKINSKLQSKIINDWKKKKSIKSVNELNNWLSLYEINYDEWIDLINSDYIWVSWCMEKFKDNLSNYFSSRKEYLDKFYYSIIKVKNKELADEFYMRIKEKESSFEEIANQFPEALDKKSKIKNGPLLINEIESSISSLIKIGHKDQLWEPKLFDGMWFIIKLENILHAEFDNNLKIKLALELGDKFLEEKFIEVQKINSKSNV